MRDFEKLHLVNTQYVSLFVFTSAGFKTCFTLSKKSNLSSLQIKNSTNDEHFFYLYIFVQTNGVHPSILIFDQVFYNAPAFKTNNNASIFRWEYSTTIFNIMTPGSLIADLVPKISSKPLSLESEKKSFVLRWLNL